MSPDKTSQIITNDVPKRNDVQMKQHFIKPVHIHVRVELITSFTNGRIVWKCETIYIFEAWNGMIHFKKMNRFYLNQSYMATPLNHTVKCSNTNC